MEHFVHCTNGVSSVCAHPLRRLASLLAVAQMDLQRHINGNKTEDNNAAAAAAAETQTHPLVGWIWKQRTPAMNAAKRVTVCLPEPPTPTSMRLPLGWDNTLAMLLMCPTASSNSTADMPLVRFCVGKEACNHVCGRDVC